MDEHQRVLLLPCFFVFLLRTRFVIAEVHVEQQRVLDASCRDHPGLPETVAAAGFHTDWGDLYRDVVAFNQSFTPFPAQNRGDEEGSFDLRGLYARGTSDGYSGRGPGGNRNLGYRRGKKKQKIISGVFIPA